MPDPWFAEMQGFPKERRTTTGFSATRQLLCRWEDRFTLRQLLIGHPGQQYPYLTVFDCRCIDVQMDPFDARIDQDTLGPTLASYEYAVLTVEYSTPEVGKPTPYPQSQDAAKFAQDKYVIAENFEPTVEGLRLDYTKFKWNTSGDPLTPDEAPVWPVRRGKYVVTRYNQTRVPTNIMDYVGTINSGQITTILFGHNIVFPAKTLLLEYPTIAANAAEDGTTKLEITYRMNFKAETWLKYWRAKAQAYDSLKVIATGTAYNIPSQTDFLDFLPQGAT